jgi:hypothetical protein
VLALNQLDVRAAKVGRGRLRDRRVRRPPAVRPGAGARDPGRRRAGRAGGHAAAGRAAAAARGRLPLRGKGRLTDADIDATAREIRIALLEADVALPVVRAFIAAIKERARGAEVSRR